MKKVYFVITLLVLTVTACTAPQRGPETSANSTLPSSPASRSSVRVSLPGTEAAEPALAADNEGNIYAVYVEHAADQSADVYLQKFDESLKQSGERVRINSSPGSAAAWRGDQPTVVASGSSIYVGWTTKVKSTAGPAEDIFLSVSRDGGKTFDPPVRINDDTAPRGHGMHALAVEGSNVYFAWLDERYLNDAPAAKLPEHKPASGDPSAPAHHPEPNREVYVAISKDAGKTFSANKKLAGGVCPCCKVQIAATAGGRVHISWRQVLPGDFRHIAVASSADGGAVFAEPVIISDDKWQLGACPVSGAALNISADGTLKTIWYTAGKAGPEGLYYSESRDGGKTFAARRPLTEGPVTGTAVLLADDGKSERALWTRDGKMFTNRLAKDAAVSSPAEILSGELPAAVNFAGVTYVCYLKKEDGNSSVWLDTLPN